MGPSRVPDPPSRATPPSTTAATLVRVAVAPMEARGSPLPVKAVVTRPASPEKSPPST